MGAHANENDTATIDTDAETWVSDGSAERLQASKDPSTAPTLRQDSDADQQSGPVRVDARSRPLEQANFGQRYEQRRMLGEGGMGEVRLCTDGRIGRDVAVKVMHAGAQTADMQARFEREARVQGQLEHPSIVPVYDLGAGPEGTTYFTMKRVRGLTLEEIIEGLRGDDPKIVEKHSRRRLLSAFSNVCLAVAFAHARGVIHRDLKPSNIILGEFGEVYVLDWGVAKIVGAPDPMVDTGDAEEEVAKLVQDSVPEVKTAAGSILGTLGYMAPEQLQGQADKISSRSDLYALGAILFEILTWQPLHPRDSVAATVASTLRGADAAVTKHANSWANMPELEEVCIKATSQNPSERYGSAREIHDAIERFLDGDRDLEKRQALAAEHTERAKKALERAQNEPARSAEERAVAVRELNSALTLNPADQAALRSMIGVLMTSTDELPPAADEELESSRMRQRSRAARAAAIGFLACFALDPLLAWVGARSWTALAAMGVPIVAIVAFGFYVSTRKRHTAAHYLILGALAATVAVATVPMFGPFMLVPGITVACMLPIAVSSRASSKRRAFLLAVGSAALVLPFTLQHFGILPQSYVFEPGKITVLPWAIEFPGEVVALLLMAEALAVLFVPMLVIGRSIDALVAAERRLFGQAWMLRQLMPEAAKGAAVAGLVEPDEDDDLSCALKSIGRPASS